MFNPDTPLSSRISTSPSTQTHFEFTRLSALAAARRYAPTISRYQPGPVSTQVGILIPALSKPGGGFTNGSNSLDASIARSTSLIAPLTLSPAGQSFFRALRKDASAMLYTPDVVGIRRDDGDRYNPEDDDFDAELDAIPADPTTRELEQPVAVNPQNQLPMGEFVAPYAINVLSAPPAVRSGKTFDDDTGCFKAVKARISRALSIFASQGDRVLVLSYDESAPIATVARVYCELLACSPVDDCSESFKNTFDSIVFAVPSKHRSSFRQAFELRLFEDELNYALSDQDE